MFGCVCVGGGDQIWSSGGTERWSEAEAVTVGLSGRVGESREQLEAGQYQPMCYKIV